GEGAQGRSRRPAGRDRRAVRRPVPSPVPGAQGPVRGGRPAAARVRRRAPRRVSLPAARAGLGGAGTQHHHCRRHGRLRAHLPERLPGGEVVCGTGAAGGTLPRGVPPPPLIGLVPGGPRDPWAGWDFSWFDGRATEERRSWGYSGLLAERMRRARAALDIQTGGGEVLGQVPDPPPVLVATESWRPNIEVARRNLRRVRGRVVEAG